MFCKSDGSGYREIAEGIYMKPLVHGENTLLTEVRIEAGSSISVHSHPHEQTGYLIQGKGEFTVKDESLNVLPGDSWCIKGEVEHSATFSQETRLIEVFSPVREEYIDL